MPYDPTPAFTVTKTADAAGDYEISLSGGCDHIFGCVPSIEESRASFTKFVRASSTPAPIAHRGARIGAVFIPVAPGSGTSLKLDSDRGMIVGIVEGRRCGQGR